MKTDKKIVDNFLSKKGRGIVIRYPENGDLRALWKYINCLSKEKTFILYQGEKISLSEEKKYLSDKIKKIKNGESVFLLAYFGRDLVGVGGVDVSKPRYYVRKHVGGFHISIAKDFRDEGVGKGLMVAVLDEVKKKLKNVKVIELEVFSNNSRAVSLYKSLGFKKFGMLPKGFYHLGKFRDAIYMFKRI